MKIFKYMALALAAVVTMGCVEEYMEPDPNKVPSASDLQVKIDVDQATNYVTFTMKNQGVVPMWIFGDQKIDKSANTRYAYTANGVSLRSRDGTGLRCHPRLPPRHSRRTLDRLCQKR